MFFKKSNNELLELVANEILLRLMEKILYTFWLILVYTSRASHCGCPSEDDGV